jgi:hypothetical protein
VVGSRRDRSGVAPGAGAGAALPDEWPAAGVPALLRAGGTGSKPPGCQGAHFSSRRSASHEPRPAPWTAIASAAYALHVGANRHRGGRAGLIARE